MLELFGVWCIVLLTLSIFSYLYGDNPFYKAAEHIFVGVSAGYIFTITFLGYNMAEFIWKINTIICKSRI